MHLGNWEVEDSKALTIESDIKNTMKLFNLADNFKK